MTLASTLTMSTLPGTASGTEIDKATLLETLRRGEEAFLKVMLGLVTGERKPRNAEEPKRDGRILRSGTDRSMRFDASDQSRPRGRFSTLAEAVAHFQAVRERTLRLVRETNEDLRATEVTHPHHVVGVISTYECLLLMGSHAERHALQIEEIKSSPAYRVGART